MDMDSLGKMIENDCSRRKCTTMEYYLEFVYKESTKIPLLPMTPQPYCGSIHTIENVQKLLD